MPRRTPKRKKALLTEEGRVAVTVRQPTLIKGRTPSPLENKFALALLGYGRDLPAPRREYQFVLAEPPENRLQFVAPRTLRPRRWAFDFAWPIYAADGRPAGGVAVEIDGGLYMASGGRHNTHADRQKMAAAKHLGWFVIHVTDHMLHNKQDCVELVRMALMRRGWAPVERTER